MRVFAWLVLAAGLAAISRAQVVSGRYIVELRGEPAVDVRATTKAAAAVRAALPNRLAAVRSQQARAFSQVSDAGFRVVATLQNVLNALVVEGDDAAATGLASLPDVQAVYPVVLHYPTLDRAVLLQNVTDAWNLTGGIGNAGLGMKIGIVDTGIDATHPGFQDADSTVPEGFPKVTRAADVGSTNNKVIVARNYQPGDASPSDIDGHGTAVAMVAAGRTSTGPYGTITGIAPKAFLGNYKVFPDGQQGAGTDVVLRAIDDAVADGMDIVNLSLSTFPSPSTSIYTSAMERANAAGVLVIVSAGNYGPDPGTIGAPAGVPAAITVGNAANDREFASAVRVDGSAPLIAVPSSNSAGRSAVSGPLRDVADVDPSGLACSALPADSLRGRIAFILRGVCVFTDKLANAERAGAVGAVVYTDAERPDAGIMAVDSTSLPAAMISNADGVALKARLAGNPELSATIDFIATAVPVSAARLSPSSSRGPGPESVLKPDLLGIGTSVSTADKSSDGGEPGYQVISGTSFSSPMVAGAAAVLRASRPGLTPAQYRSLLVNAASTFSYGSSGVPGPVQQTGAGLLNVAASLRSTIAVSPTSINFGTGTASVNKAVSIAVSNLGTAGDTLWLTTEPMNGGPAVSFSQDPVALAPGESKVVQVRLEAADLPPGAQQGFVAVKSSVSDAQARLAWWYAVPSGVVASITVGRVPESGSRLSTQTFYVRPSDATGLPVEVLPEVRVVAGEGNVEQVSWPDRYPGFCAVRVRLGPAAGTNTFEISAKGVTTRVSIPGR